MENTPGPDDTPAVQPPIGGRKPLPDHLKRKRRLFWLTDVEYEHLQRVLAGLREGKRS